MRITVVGNLTADPELRFTPSGKAVAKFTVVENKRTFNKDTNEWEDGDPSFVNCDVWESAAENVAESLVKGTRVIVTGELSQRTYQKDGENRTVWDCRVDEVGPALKWATARVTRSQGTGQGSRGGRPQGAPQGGQGADPWASAPAAGRPSGDPFGGQPGNAAPQSQDPWATRR